MPTKRPRRSNNAVQEHAEEDLRSAIQASTTLEQVSGAPQSKDKREIWSDRFAFWWEEVQGHNPDECPTAKDLEIYILGSMLRGVQGLESISDNQYFAPTFLYVQQGIAYIKAYLNFTYPQWHTMITPHTEARLEESLATLEMEGAITRDEKIARQWAGVEMARLLIWTLYDDSHLDRAACHMKTIHKMCAILLNLGLISRPGSIMRSKGYIGLETLLWCHVEFRFLNGSSRKLSELSVILTLSNEKGSNSIQTSKSKESASKKKTKLQKATKKSIRQRTRPFNAFKQPRNFLLCVPKMMLAFAISSGITVERTLTDILASQGNVLQLVEDAEIRPVFIRFKSWGMDPDVFIPAGVKQLEEIIDHARILAHIQEKVRPRAFRNGALRELSRVSTAITEAHTATPGIAKAANHALSSMEKNLTDNYIGPQVVDNLTARVELADTNPDPVFGHLGFTIATESHHQPAKFTSEQIDVEVKRVGKDANSELQRSLASQRLRRARMKDSDRNSRSQTKSGASIREALQPLEPNALLQPPAKRARITFPPSLKRPQPSSQLSRSALLNSQNSRVPSKMLPASLPFLSAIDSALHPPFGPGSASPSSASDPSPYASMLDPVMIASSKAAELVQTRGTSATPIISDPAYDETHTNTLSVTELILGVDMEQLEDMQAMFVIGNEENPARHSENDVEFVNLLVENARKSFTSNINSQSSGAKVTCPNPKCNWKGMRKYVWAHLEKDVCMYEEYLVSNLAESANPPYAKTYVCIEADCDQRFYTQTGLGLHVRDHIFEPQKCPYLPDCSSNKVFQNAKSLSSHTQNHLKGFRATKCTFKGCPDNTIFRWSEALKAHLIQKHSLSKGAERKAYMLPHKAADVRESLREGDDNDKDNDESE